ncbi:MAG: LysR substrate-binding domain-containing protein [Reinekea sp.]
MPQTVQKLLNRMSLRQLVIFQTVYQQRGYSKAADLLGLSQPAVSSQIRQLESALGFKLFDYIGRTLYCTPIGERVSEAIDRVFDEFRAMHNDIHSIAGHISGELRLAVVTTAQYVVPWLSKQFTEYYPHIRVHIDVVNRAQAVERLNANIDDLTIMGLVPTDRPLVSIPFLDNELTPVVPPEHPLLAQKGPIDTQQFINSRLLLREAGSGSRLALEQYCHQHRLKLTADQEIGSTEVIKHAVMAGSGVAILPLQAIKAELALGLLHAPEVKLLPLRRSWCLVHPVAKNLSPVTRQFIQFVQSNLRAIHRNFYPETVVE